MAKFMRRSRSPREVNEAIQSLLRIRGSQVKPDAQGLRTVWHQSGHGVDLISYVDTTGRVTRQEFTLFDEYFSWSHDKGLRTGTVSEESASAGVKATPLVKFDPEIDYERVDRALQALGAYSGDDRYLLHLKRLLALMLQGLQSTEAEQVTAVEPAFEPEDDTDRKRRSRRILALSVAGALILLLTLALLLRRL